MKPTMRRQMKTPPRRNPGGVIEAHSRDSGLYGVAALAVLALGRGKGPALLLFQGGAGHIMHMLRNLSRFTINGSICSARVFPSCVECGARTGTVWFASRQKETPLPFRLG